jgi:vesicular inhibitory amino acid transporter
MERPEDFEQMIDLSFLTVLGCCLVMAIRGYHMFGSLVEDKEITILLQNFSSAEAAMDCLTRLMILTTFSKFMLTTFPLALGIEEIFAPCVPNESVSEVVSSLIKLLAIDWMFLACR